MPVINDSLEGGPKYTQKGAHHRGLVQGGLLLDLQSQGLRLHFPAKWPALAPGKEYCVPSTVGLVHSQPTAKIWVTTVCGLQTSQATTTNSLSFSVPPKTSHTYVKVMLMFDLSMLVIDKVLKMHLRSQS